jgi:hypothetical protein
MKLFLCCNITISLAVPGPAVRPGLRRRAIGDIIAPPAAKGNATEFSGFAGHLPAGLECANIRFAAKSPALRANHKP